MPPNGNGPAVHIDHLTKRFGDFVAVDDISLDVHRGEILASSVPMARESPPPYGFYAACSAPPPGKQPSRGSM